MKELSHLKSVLAKQWGVRKAELTKEVAKSKGRSFGSCLLKALEHTLTCYLIDGSRNCASRSGSGDASTLIHEAEASFLQSCVLDLRQALDAK